MEAAEKSLFRQLQRAFVSLTNEWSKWTESQAGCNSTLTMIEKQAERLQCCLHVSDHHALLLEYPDLKERLTNKISVASQDQLLELRKSL